MDPCSSLDASPGVPLDTAPVWGSRAPLHPHSAHDNWRACCSPVSSLGRARRGGTPWTAVNPKSWRCFRQLRESKGMKPRRIVWGPDHELMSMTSPFRSGKLRFCRAVSFSERSISVDFLKLFSQIRHKGKFRSQQSTASSFLRCEGHICEQE